MTRYERKVLAVDGDGGFNVEGRVVAILDSPRAGQKSVTALVEVPETKSPAPATFEDDSGEVDVYETGNPDPVTTVGSEVTFFCEEAKSDGEPCGREVGGPDETCWQHSD